MTLVLVAAALATPTFSVERGVHEDAFTLDITASEGGTLYVSTSAAEPTEAYSGPLTISATTVVRAVEVDGAGVSSPTVTYTYIFPADVVTSAVMDTTIAQDPAWQAVILDSLAEMPSASLVVPAGMTMTEQAVSFEWMEPDGSNSQVPAGSRIVGGTSYVYAKTSFRLTFRESYGEGKWDFDPFSPDNVGVEPVEHHDQLTLRSGNHDSLFYLGTRGQLLRNRWMDETKLEMGHLSLHGRYVHLYLNGAYHGLYHLRERGDSAWLAEYLGGDEDDYESVLGGTAFDGSGATWSALVAASGDWTTAQQYLNVEDFLDYMVLNYYAANAWDWLYYHNWMASGPVDPDDGGFVFQSSDSDICLYYDYTTNILSLGGPSNVFYYLNLEGDPDFRVALADAIHRNLEDGGTLTADNAGARYARLAAGIEDAVVAESARWGYGTWNRAVWEAERDNLLTNFFPYRTTELLRQVRAAGWYPLDAPELDVDAGPVPAGTEVHVTAPDGSNAEVWVSLDGEDPRLSGGALADGAIEGPLAVTIDRSTVVKARLRDGETWGPIAQAFYEVDEAPAIVLNEWNAVDDDEVLSGGDAGLGQLAGNGGDWIELLVLRDLDLRGWRLTMADRRGEAGAITLSDADLLADVRAGTILTIAEDLPEDPAYDPDGGDWRFHLRAAPDGAYAVSDGFDVTARDWTFTLWDADGFVAFGPVGETVAPLRGLGGDEVGLLAATPDRGLRRDSALFLDGDGSTFGAPNAWEDGEQDLRALRGQSTGGVLEVPDDTGGAVADEPVDAPGGCGCATPASPGASPGAAAMLLAIAALRRRLRTLWPLALVACGGDKSVDVGDAVDSGERVADCFADLDQDGWGDPDRALPCESDVAVDVAGDCDDADASVSPDAPEVCGGGDEDCDGLQDDEDTPADPLPFYADADGDGYGDDTLGLVGACAAGDGFAMVGGDCDDADPAISPGAVEACDDVDQDCDGTASDAVGASSECPAASCLAAWEEDPAAADGAYWVTLASGTVAPVWCDMENGGWTLGFLRNSTHSGSQADFGAGEESLDGLATDPAAASTSATPVMSWHDLNLFSGDTIRLTGYGGGSLAYTSRDIPRSELRISFGEDGYLLYGGSTGYYWCGGSTSYTDGGVGATNNPSGAYADCKGHGSLGSGYDFSESDWANSGLTLCGGDGSAVMTAYPGSGWTYFGYTGASQAIWVK